MKKFLLSLFLLFSSLFVFAQEEKLSIVIPSFDNDGKIVETTYSKEMPKTYEESIETIKLLKEIYDEVTNNYKNQVNDLEEYSNKILDELESANNKIDTLNKLNETKETIKEENKTIDETDTSLKNYFDSFGIIAEYGCLTGSNEVAIKFGIKLWKLSFTAGPNILIPVNTADGSSSVQFGFRGSIGIWF